MEELNALKETLQRSSVIHGPSPSNNEDSSLANAAEIKAIGLSISATSGQLSSDISSNRSPVPLQQSSSHNDVQGPPTNSVLRNNSAVYLASINIRDFVAMQGNPKMGIARYNEEIVLIECKDLPVYSRSKIMA